MESTREGRFLNWLIPATVLCATATVLVPASLAQVATVKRVALRAEPATITLADIDKMVKENGFSYPSRDVVGTFAHSYQKKSLQGVPVVVDHATGLMWQWDASEYTIGAGAQRYIDRLNTGSYAGFSDWRLPTTEELLSLIEPQQIRPRTKYLPYIDPIFDQNTIIDFWTADLAPCDSDRCRWYIEAIGGRANFVGDTWGSDLLIIVKAVRSLKERTVE